MKKNKSQIYVRKTKVLSIKSTNILASTLELSYLLFTQIGRNCSILWYLRFILLHHYLHDISSSLVEISQILTKSKSLNMASFKIFLTQNKCGKSNMILITVSLCTHFLVQICQNHPLATESSQSRHFSVLYFKQKIKLGSSTK